MANKEIDAYATLRAAIQLAEARGAIVKWNDSVDDLQFYATIRIRRGSCVYLLVVDCIEIETPLGVEAIEAFAAKSKAAKAQMAFLATMYDHTQEAATFAVRNGIRLLTHDNIPSHLAEEICAYFEPVINVRDFRFERTDGNGDIVVPEEPELLKYFMQEMAIESSNLQTVPERIVNDQYATLAAKANGSPQWCRVLFPQNVTIRHPNTGHRTSVKAFRFMFQLMSAHDLARKDGLGVDPYLIDSDLVEAIHRRNPSADPNKVKNGFDTHFKVGAYYYNPRFRFSYYCEAIKKSLARMMLVESYQAGQLIQARLRVPLSASSKFIEITDLAEIARLKTMYEALTISDKCMGERFKVFARTVSGAECIDELSLTLKQATDYRADYFFEDRQIIAECKTLETDTSPKIDTILAPYQASPEWPLFYGEQSLQKILAHLPDRDKINERIIAALTDSIEGLIEKANRQIRATKATFNLPGSSGLLIIFNDLVEVFSPELVEFRVRKSLRKKASGGGARYPHICLVIVINGAHYTQVTPRLKAIPIMTIANTIDGVEAAERFAAAIIEQWSKFNKMPLIHRELERTEKLRFKAFAEDAKEQDTPLTVADLWRYEYRKRPYLRSRTKTDLLEWGKNVFEELSPCFLKGAPKMELEKRNHLIERWTHFLEEVNFREIDMNEWTPFLNDSIKKWNKTAPQ